MIREVHGDILLTGAQAIAHGVSPNDDFGQGLALSLREQWPALYKDFRHYCHDAHPKAGDAWLWGAADGTRIVSLMTQEYAYDHGEKPGTASLPNVNHALRSLHKRAQAEGLKSLALPRLATGVGRLEWEDVYTRYEKGVRATET